MIRTWAWVGIGAQVMFTVAWLVAQAWQPPTYRPLAHTISDRYAVGAPYPAVLMTAITLSGAGTIAFAVGALRPALAGHWTGIVGWLLVAVSILGLGDLLTVFEREGCQLAVAGCTPKAQTANAGGALDAALSSFGLVALGISGFFIGTALRKRPALARFAWPARIGGVLVLVLLFAMGAFGAIGLSGLGERIIAVAACAGGAGLALIVRRAASAEGEGAQPSSSSPPKPIG